MYFYFFYHLIISMLYFSNKLAKKIYFFKHDFYFFLNIDLTKINIHKYGVIVINLIIITIEAQIVNAMLLNYSQFLIKIIAHSFVKQTMSLRCRYLDYLFQKETIELKSYLLKFYYMADDIIHLNLRCKKLIIFRDFLLQNQYTNARFDDTFLRMLKIFLQLLSCNDFIFYVRFFAKNASSVTMLKFNIVINFWRIIFFAKNFKILSTQKSKKTFNNLVILHKTLLFFEGDFSLLILYASLSKYKTSTNTNHFSHIKRWLFFFSERSLSVKQAITISLHFDNKTFRSEQSCRNKNFFHASFNDYFYAFFGQKAPFSKRTKKRIQSLIKKNTLKHLRIKEGFNKWDLKNSYLLRLFRPKLLRIQKLFHMLPTSQFRVRRILFFFTYLTEQTSNFKSDNLTKLSFLRLYGLLTERKEDLMITSSIFSTNNKFLSRKSDLPLNSIAFFLMCAVYGNIKSCIDYFIKIFQYLFNNNIISKKNSFSHAILFEINWIIIVSLNKKRLQFRNIFVSPKLKPDKNFAGLKSCKILEFVKMEIDSKKTPVQLIKAADLAFSKKKNDQISSISRHTETIIKMSVLLNCFIANIKSKNGQTIIFHSIFKSCFISDKKNYLNFLLPFMIIFDKKLNFILYILRKNVKKKKISKILGSCFFCLWKMISKIFNRHFNSTGTKTMSRQRMRIDRHFSSKILSNHLQRTIFNFLIDQILQNNYKCKKFLITSSVSRNIFFQFWKMTKRGSDYLFSPLMYAKQLFRQENNFSKILEHSIIITFLDNFKNRKQKDKSFISKKNVFDSCLAFIILTKNPIIEIFSHFFKSKIFSKDYVLRQFDAELKRLRFFLSFYHREFNFSNFHERIVFQSLFSNLICNKNIGYKTNVEFHIVNSNFKFFDLSSIVTSILPVSIKKNFELISKRSENPFFSNFSLLMISISNISCFLHKNIFNIISLSKSFLLIHEIKPKKIFETFCHTRFSVNRFWSKFYLFSTKNFTIYPFLTKGIALLKIKNFLTSFQWFAKKKKILLSINDVHVVSNYVHFFYDCLEKNTFGDFFLFFFSFFTIISENQKTSLIIWILSGSQNFFSFFSSERRNKRGNLLSIELLESCKTIFRKKILYCSNQHLMRILEFFWDKLECKKIISGIFLRRIFSKNIPQRNKFLHKKTIFFFLIFKLIDTGFCRKNVTRLLCNKFFHLFICTEILLLCGQKSKIIMKMVGVSLNSLNRLNCFGYFNFLKIHWLTGHETREKNFWLTISLTRQIFHVLTSKKCSNFGQWLGLHSNFLRKLLISSLKQIEKLFVEKPISHQLILGFNLLCLITPKVSIESLFLDTLRKIYKNLIVNLYEDKINFTKFFYKSFFSVIMKFSIRHVSGFFDKNIFTTSSLKSSVLFLKFFFRTIVLKLDSRIILCNRVSKHLFHVGQDILNVVVIYNLTFIRLNRKNHNNLFTHFKTISDIYVFAFGVGKIDENLHSIFSLYIENSNIFSKIFARVRKNCNLERLCSYLTMRKIYSHVSCLYKREKQTSKFFGPNLFLKLKFYVNLAAFAPIKHNQYKSNSSIILRNYLVDNYSYTSSQIPISSYCSVFEKFDTRLSIRLILEFLNFKIAITDVIFFSYRFKVEQQFQFKKKADAVVVSLLKCINFQLFQKITDHVVIPIIMFFFNTGEQKLKMQALKVLNIFLKFSSFSEKYLDIFFSIVFIYLRTNSSLYSYKLHSWILKFLSRIKMGQIRIRVLSLFLLRSMVYKNTNKNEKFYGCIIRLLFAYDFFESRIFPEYFFSQILHNLVGSTNVHAMQFDGYLIEYFIFYMPTRQYLQQRLDLFIKIEYSTHTLKLLFLIISSFFIQNLDTVNIDGYVHFKSIWLCDNIDVKFVQNRFIQTHLSYLLLFNNNCFWAIDTIFINDIVFQILYNYKHNFSSIKTVISLCLADKLIKKTIKGNLWLLKKNIIHNMMVVLFYSYQSVHIAKFLFFSANRVVFPLLFMNISYFTKKKKRYRIALVGRTLLEKPNTINKYTQSLSKVFWRSVIMLDIILSTHCFTFGRFMYRTSKWHRTNPREEEKRFPIFFLLKKTLKLLQTRHSVNQSA